MNKREMNKREKKDLRAAYREMAQDAAAEAEALEWIEALIGDVADVEEIDDPEPGIRP